MNHGDFKQFISDIRKIDGVWESDDVYFSQMRDGYSASYKPNYPDNCINDMIIQTIYDTGACNRGNYELIIWENGKYSSKYFHDTYNIKEFYNTKEE